MMLAGRFDTDRYLEGKPQRPGFREWAIRANNRIEAAMDQTDWKGIELMLEKKILPVLGCGVVLYFLFVLADAILSGAIAKVVR